MYYLNTLPNDIDSNPCFFRALEIFDDWLNNNEDLRLAYAKLNKTDQKRTVTEKEKQNVVDHVKDLFREFKVSNQTRQKAYVMSNRSPDGSHDKVRIDSHLWFNMKNTQEGDDEFEKYSFLGAVIIAHEIGYIKYGNTWKDERDTPEKYDNESGNFVEREMFGGRISHSGRGMTIDHLILNKNGEKYVIHDM